MDKDAYLSKLDSDGIHVTTRPYLDKVSAHVEPYIVKVFGQPITVLPCVMSPKYDWAGLLMIETLPEDLSGQDVLELGSGAGLVSVFAGLRNARSVTATDINPAAVENSRLNFKKLGLSNASAILSDVFENVPKKKYHVIIFNLPYHDAVPTNELEKGVMDQNYTVMDNFLARAKKYLHDNGTFYIGFSRSGNVNHLEEQLTKNGIEVEYMLEKNEWNEPAYEGHDFHYNCQIYVAH